MGLLRQAVEIGGGANVGHPSDKIMTAIAGVTALEQDILTSREEGIAPATGDLGHGVDYGAVLHRDPGAVPSDADSRLRQARREAARTGSEPNRRGACVGLAERSERSQPHARASAA